MAHQLADNAKWPSRESCEVSGLITVDTALYAGSALLNFVHVIPDGADCEVLIYDHATAASGTVKAAVVLASADKMGGFEGKKSRRMYNGIYVKIVLGTPRVLVGYQP